MLQTGANNKQSISTIIANIRNNGGTAESISDQPVVWILKMTCADAAIDIVIKPLHRHL